MKKTLFTAALAFVLSIGGFALSADDVTVSDNSDESGLWDLQLVVKAKDKGFLTKGLASLAAESNNKSFGYYKNKAGEFVSLADSMKSAKAVVDANGASVTFGLGKFDANETLQFGYGSNPDPNATPGQSAAFEPINPSLTVSSDAGFHAGYDIDSFYQLDFPKDPFNGKIEIYVMGEPLPASTVTLLVALGAAAAFLLYNNRKTRVRRIEQA